MRRLATGGLIAVFVGVLNLPARTAPPQQPSRAQVPGAFRSAITMVPVDVRVVDRNGRPVTGLERSDFTILEDGVPQEIAHFEARALTAHPPAAGEATPALRRAPGGDVAGQDHRIFLILLGRGRLREPSGALDALRQFVGERLLPQDQVAVFAWDRATDFTTDHERIARVLGQFDRVHESIESKLAFHFSGLAAYYGSKDIPADIQADIDAIFEGTPNRRVLRGAVSDSVRLESDATRVIADLVSTGTSLMTDLPLAEFVYENARTMQDLGNLYAGLEYLRYLDGEKHLVLVTEKGLFLPREEDDKRIAEAASSARVAIDTVETGGLFVGVAPGLLGPTPGQWTQLWSFGTLRAIAELSGGSASVCEYTRQAVERIDDTTRAGYLLAYYPKRVASDGKYRQITVKVNRANMTPVYRHGYEATDQFVPFDRRSFLTSTRMMAAAQYGDDLRDIKVRASATRARVDVQIDASRLTFAPENGARVARLDIAVLPIGRKGRIRDDRWDKIELTLGDAELARYRREGLRYSIALPAAANAEKVRVVVYDYAADLLGATTVKVF